MMTRQLTVSFCTTLAMTLWTAEMSAALIATLHSGASFPSAAEFQTFNPHDAGTPTGSERTLHTTRSLTQSFQLSSAVDVDEIDLLYVRGTTGATGRVRIFSVADALAGDLTGDFDDAVANGFLLDDTFVLPESPNDNVERTLKLVLPNPVSLPAVDSPGGYALNLTSADGTSEIFTWRFGDPGSGSGSGWYAGGRVFYDDFVSSGSTETRRDGLFALNGDVSGPVVPEPSSLLLLALAGGGLYFLRRA